MCRGHCFMPIDCGIINIMKIKDVQLNKRVLKNQGVDLVLVFGSRIEGCIHPKSDVDIGVVFRDNKKKNQKPVEIYGSLIEEFAERFKTKNIDIVYLRETPLSLQYKAVTTGIVLYQSSSFDFFDYKEMILRKYFDFKYFEDIFNHALTGHAN